MSTRHTLALATILAIAATPLASEAASPHKAMNACIAAFVDQYVPKGHPVVVRKMIPAPSPLDVLMRQNRYTIALEARTVQSNVQLAQARCVASPRGDVIVLDSPPADTYVASADFTAVVSR